MTLTEAFNRRIPWPIRFLIAAGVALLFAHQAYPRLSVIGWAAFLKVRGRAEECSWSQIITSYGRLSSYAKLRDSAATAARVQEYDSKLGAELVETPRRSFWIKRAGNREGSRELLAYLLAEHDWLLKENPERSVRRGDIVLDCGAHVGTFAHQAMELGAARVVAIEPDPINVECLRRNFKREIADGRMILAPVGVWHEEGKLALHVDENSAGHSLVLHPEDKTLEVPVTRIDKLVEDLKLPHVNYIKMDIEGAERQALAGAVGTLQKYRPRLMLSAYHLPDDKKVLPMLVWQADPNYRLTYGPCAQPDSSTAELLSHIIYFH